MTAVAARVRKIVATLQRTHPDAKLALDFSTPLELLVALILAAQARDDLVNVVTRKLFQRYRTANDWMRLKEDDVRKINFYRQKTRSIRRAPFTSRRWMALSRCIRILGRFIMARRWGFRLSWWGAISRR